MMGRDPRKIHMEGNCDPPSRSGVIKPFPEVWVTGGPTACTSPTKLPFLGSPNLVQSSADHAFVLASPTIPVSG